LNLVLKTREAEAEQEEEAEAVEEEDCDKADCAIIRSNARRTQR
jgi:hypothetical protein